MLDHTIQPFRSMLRRVEAEQIEKVIAASFRGAPSGLITAGLMALAFMGFSDFARLQATGAA